MALDTELRCTFKSLDRKVRSWPTVAGRAAVVNGPETVVCTSHKQSLVSWLFRQFLFTQHV